MNACGMALATFLHIQAKFDQEEIPRMVRLIRWHYFPDNIFFNLNPSGPRSSCDLSTSRLYHGGFSQTYIYV